MLIILSDYVDEDLYFETQEDHTTVYLFWS